MRTPFVANSIRSPVRSADSMGATDWPTAARCRDVGDAVVVRRSVTRRSMPLAPRPAETVSGPTLARTPGREPERMISSCARAPLANTARSARREIRCFILLTPEEGDALARAATGVPHGLDGAIAI